MGRFCSYHSANYTFGGGFWKIVLALGWTGNGTGAKSPNGVEVWEMPCPWYGMELELGPDPQLEWGMETVSALGWYGTGAVDTSPGRSVDLMGADDLVLAGD